jgi:hypothetical protein
MKFWQQYRRTPGRDERQGNNRPILSNALRDILKQKLMANLFGALEGKRFWEIASIMCTVLTSNGESKVCGFTTEFASLAGELVDVTE